MTRVYKFREIILAKIHTWSRNYVIYSVLLKDNLIKLVLVIGSINFHPSALLIWAILPIIANTPHGTL